MPDEAQPLAPSAERLGGTAPTKPEPASGPAETPAGKTASGPVELALVPRRAVDGATVTVEVVAGAASAVVTFAAPTRARPPVTVPAGKRALLTVRYSARVESWAVVSAEGEP